MKGLCKVLAIFVVWFCGAAAWVAIIGLGMKSYFYFNPTPPAVSCACHTTNTNGGTTK